MPVYREHLRQVVPPADSWWVGLTRQAFAARARREFETRMSLGMVGPAYSSPGSIVDQERVPVSWITRGKGESDDA